MFCLWPRETIDKLSAGSGQCCASLHPCCLTSCIAKGFSPKRVSLHYSNTTLEQSCDLTGTSVQSKPLSSWSSFFFPFSFSPFPSLQQGQERELLSTYGHTCCLYCTLQFRYIQKSRLISVFLAEDILKKSRKGHISSPYQHSPNLLLHPITQSAFSPQ